MPPLVLALAALPLTLGAGCVAEGAPVGEQAASAPDAASPLTPGDPPDPPLDGRFDDAFERDALGPDWRVLSGAWRIEGGRLCGQRARNRGAWLRRTLPASARVEVTAIAGSPDGDLKLELWGDGRSGATAATYDHATGYVAILGGWRNQRHVLARLDEHGEDRLALAVDASSDDPRLRPVVPGRPYRLAFERRDGRTVRWTVDGVVVHELVDEEPLRGPGHDHVGVNAWEAPVCFDDLHVVTLEPDHGPQGID